MVAMAIAVSLLRKPCPPDPTGTCDRPPNPYMLARQLWFAHLLRLLTGAGIVWLLVAQAGWSWTWAVLLALALLLASHVGFIGLQFLLSRPAFGGSPTPPEFALSRTAAWRMFLEEAWSSLREFDLIQPLLGGRTLASAPVPGATDRLPVLFIHGFYCNRAVWRPLARHLAAQGHVTGSVNLEPVFTSIDDYIEVVARGVRELQARSGEEEVALVCHSMGGLVARAYLVDRGAFDIVRVITVGSPHRGTRQARIAFARNVAQQRFDSEWLQRLAARERREDRQLFSVFLSHHDNIVSPQSIQILPDAEIIELGGVGHLAMLYRRPLWLEISDRLRRDGWT